MSLDLDLQPSPTADTFYSSPSQVSTYELCPRKWAHRYVDGVVAPPNKFAAFGIRVHKYLEDWLKKKDLPAGESREAKVARAMIPYLPPPQAVDPANVENEGGGVQLGGINFILKKDLYMPMWEGMPTVFDHKTSGNFNWVLTPESMPGDTQASLYAAWGLIKSGAPRVRLVWNYGRREGAAKVHPVRCEVSGRDVAERLEKSIESAKESRAILESGVSAMQVRYDASACKALGGCPYQSLCNLTPQEKMESIMHQASDKRSFLNRVDAKKNGQAAAPQAVNPPVQATPTPAAAAAPVTATPSPASSALAAKLAARKAAQAAPAPAAAPAPVPVQEAPAPAVPDVVVVDEPQAAAGPKPARGPGRPPKQAGAADRWPEFAGIALEGVLGKLDLDDLADDEMRDGAVEAAAGVADSMLRQWTQRFGV